MVIQEGLASAVNSAYDIMGKEISEIFFKEQVAAKMGLAATSIDEYFRNYAHGKYYGSASDNPLNQQERLDNLSIILFALGFSKSDDLQVKVLSGLEKKAKEKNQKFVYPPPQDKGISYEEIKQLYVDANGETPTAGPKVIEKVIETVENRVIRYLKRMYSVKPDNLYTARGIIRDFNIGTFDSRTAPTTVGVTLYVTPLESRTDDVFPVETLVISHTGNEGGNQIGTRTWKELKQFLSDFEGKKARIVYDRVQSRVNPLVVQMIAPVNSKTIFIRDDGFLKPYNKKDNKFIPV